MNSGRLLLWLIMLTASFAVAKPEGTRVVFRESQLKSYRLKKETAGLVGTKWLEASPESDPLHAVRLSDRVVLQVKDQSKLKSILAGSPLQISRVVTDTVVILQAPDAWTSIRESERISQRPDVIACHPLMQNRAEPEGQFAKKPNDYWYDIQFYFQNRDPISATLWGPDLNIRAAWPFTRGAGTTIAIADWGVEINHPDLVARTQDAPHFNFETGQTNGSPPSLAPFFSHGTAVAGMAAATANNSIGIAGAAPEARLASWVLFTTNQFLVDEEKLMDMFSYQSNVVHVQNHSWGNHVSVFSLTGPGALAQIGISNAITFGREGRGVVIVRSGGNGRQVEQNVNDNSYRSDPRVICVAAAKLDGRVTTYSSPGAPILVAAIGAESGGDPMITTDRQGSAGYNANFAGAKSPYQSTTDTNFLNYYLYFTGTSAAAPQISGLAALMLSANTNLTYRDVQQILLHSARHFDFADPDLTTNGAGLLVSHNLGFGIPDAGEALRRAISWPNRPAITNLVLTSTNSAQIPDGGLRLHIIGENVPSNIVSIAAAPSTGPHADSPTLALPLVDVGIVTNQVTQNLTNKAALIQHTASLSFSDEITRAAQAGAAFAAIFYTSDLNVPPFMAGTDFVPIPAVLIGNTRGLALRSFLQTNATSLAQLRLNPTNYQFAVSDTLSCEYIGVRISFAHGARGDLRLTLTSPQGTRSVLQRANNDTNSSPVDWTYWSTHHFYESSAGTWTLSVGDEFPGGGIGTVESVDLIIRGTTIADLDHDGLDDQWETNHFASLISDPRDDSDKDGYNNAREQIIGTNPAMADAPFELDLSPWNRTLARLSWPASSYFNYDLFTGTNVANLTFVTNLSGKFPETEWYLPYTNALNFQRVFSKPNP